MYFLLSIPKHNAVDFFMGPAGPWKNPHLLWFYLGVLFWFLDLRVSMSSQFQRNKASIGLKLTVKLQKSYNSANLCSRIIGFTFYSTVQLTQNNSSVLQLNEKSWLQGSENSVFKFVLVFSRFYLSLTEVYQDKTRMFYVHMLFCLSSQDLLENRSHFTGSRMVVMMPSGIFECFFC